MKIGVRFDGLNNEDINVFCDMMSYVSPHILETIKHENYMELEIENESKEEVENRVEELRKMINSSDMKLKNRINTNILEDYWNRELINEAPIFEELKEKKSIIEVSEGAYVYGGIFLKIFKYFCKKVEEFGMENWEGIIEYTMPVLFPIDIYEKGLYFENFPHHIMFQTTLKNDLEVLNKFSQNGTKDGEIFKHIMDPNLVLRHAACVPIYPMLENMVFDEKDLPIKFLISGKCFRNEGHNVYELARLKEFYMKEYVFIGSEEQVLENLKKARELWRYWINVFGWKCKVETANDSFFASNYSKLKLFQLLGDSKQELRMALPASNMECAVSSTNVHRTHFTKSHNIKCGDSYCVSGCIAFGIERLSYSLLCQKGLNIEKWDEKSRQEVFEE